MGENSKKDLPWRVQWHVTVDGTVIQQRSRGDGLHQQLFQSFATTRPVTVAELDALSVRSGHEMRRITPFDVLWNTGWVVFVAGLTLGGGLVFNSVSGDLVPGLILGFLLALALVSPTFAADAREDPMSIEASLSLLLIRMATRFGSSR